MTIKEIAERAGVSAATVSYVINGTKNVAPERRRRVQEVIDEAGYKPNYIAQSLRAKKTNTIGVLVEDIRGASVPGIVNGISGFAEQKGYDLLLNDLGMLDRLNHQYDKLTKQKPKINNAVSLLLHSARVDAIIYVGMFSRDLTGIFDETGKPLVVAHSVSNDPFTKSVMYDNENISAEAARYLLDMGHRRVGVITGIANTIPVELRMRGIRRAFSEKGLILDTALVKNGDWEYASGYSRMAEFLDTANPPTAVFAMSDPMAIGAVNAINDRGLNVPGDVSVVGFDNREIASYVRPKLTTIEIDIREIGVAAAKAAIEMIDSRTEEARTEIIPGRFLVRDSVKARGL